MRKCEVLFSPTIEIVIGDNYNDKEELEYLEEADKYDDIAIGKLDKDGKLVYVLALMVSAKDMLKTLKDDELFNGEVFDISIRGIVWDEKDKKSYWEDVATFEGTLYDVLLVAANKGAKYDLG